MGIECLTEKCRGRVGGRTRRFWDGDQFPCPKCGAVYVIDVTDDYADDAVASLRLKSPAPSATPERGGGR